MKRFPVFILSLLAVVALSSCANTPAKKAGGTQGNVYDFTMTSIAGDEVNLADYRGKVIVFVNVASKCGYTPQYADLQKFYDEYKDQGVVVLGFPANNFMGQEPGSDEQIATFCQKNYGVSFPMFSKISVKGGDQHPLYAYLTGAVNQNITWNFNKIVVDRNGKPVQHFKSGVKPGDEAFVSAIKKLL